jgi:predicted O-linked N-acetylglucosamine transferase (SPINDLY family)
MSTTDSALVIAALIKSGVEHHQAGRIAEAAMAYRQALQLDPGHIEALVLLGMIAGQSGQLPKAAELFTRALERDSGNAQIHHNLGETWRHLGQFQKAQASLRCAIELDPDHIPAYQSGADLMLEEAKRQEATGNFAEARELRQAAVKYLFNAGNKQLIKHLNVGAAESYRTALKLDPDNAEIWACLSHTMTKTPSEQVKVLRHAIALDPKIVWAYGQLGNALVAIGLNQEAEATYRKGLVINPDSFACQQGLDSLKLMVPLYDAANDAPKIFEIHRAWGDVAMTKWRPANPVVFANERDPKKRLKVGYISGDFTWNSISYFFVQMLERHDPAAVEVFCYSLVDRHNEDEATTRMKKLVHHWRDIRDLNLDAICARIRRDGIDILIDLAGHTGRNRLDVFVVKPAPVTATWLGYPATTGLPNIDWRITDAIADPPGSEKFHTEKLMRLESGFLCYRPPEDAPEVAPLPALSSGRLTFGSFNMHHKIVPEVAAVWTRILEAIPSSRLVLKSFYLGDEPIRQRILGFFTERGISPDRIDINKWKGERADHLAAYSEIDMALDPFPYNGTTTSCEALWMGVPVVTLIGDRHSGRVGFDLLTRIGLERFAAPDVDSYVRLAAEAAKDLAALSVLRPNLREQMRTSPLCDERRFVREFEAALREMWRQWCASTA